MLTACTNTALAVEFGLSLCQCSCHASCPVQYEGNRRTISDEAWYTSCTCTGAEAARQRLRAGRARRARS